MGDHNSSLVQAVFAFKGKNNDELCFKKGDVIAVTQREDGGWWEGTLAGVTGWFPSNYVKEHKTQGMLIDTKLSPVKTAEELANQQKAYRNLVLKDLIDSERAHVAELLTLVSNFLEPLLKSELLTKDEYRQLVGNLDTVMDMHKKLLASLEAAAELPPLDQRVGHLFMTTAPLLRQVHLSYCSSHPRAVCVLNKHKDALNNYMETQGAASPGLLVLTTGLSKPFRRLEKYSGMLQELERHMEESHPDRGDTQRSVPVYKDIWSACSTTRRQKEQELEVLTGGVRGWEGEDLTSLGEILQMGSVAVGQDHRDRYLVLFPGTLLILSVSTRMSGFIYEGKLPLSGISVSPLPDSDTCKNAFEVTGPLIERILAVCQTREEQQAWVDSLRSAIQTMKKTSVASSAASHGPISRTSSTMTGVKTHIPVVKQDPNMWSVTCLKPLPPLRSRALLNHAKKAKTPLSPTKSVDNNFEEDIQILRVIEAYCSNSSVRNTMSPGQEPNLDYHFGESPPSQLWEPLTKLWINYLRQKGRLPNKPVNGVLSPGKTMASKEKYVMDNIDLLRRQMTDMLGKVHCLTSRLDDEIRTRALLQDSVQAYLHPQAAENSK